MGAFNRDQVAKVKRFTFDEALAETKFGKFNYFVIIVSGFILINVVFESLGISFILPVSECDLNLTVQEKGILSGINIAGVITSSHLWGFLADTIGRRRIIRPTLMIAFAISVMSSFATNFLVLVILRFINGIFISAASATIYAYLGEFHSSKLRNRAIMGAAFTCAFFSILFPISAWLVINQNWSFYVPILGIIYKPWRLYMIVCGVPGFICGLCLFKIPESPKFLYSVGNEEAALKGLRKIYRMNSGSTATEYPVKSILPELDTSRREKLNLDKNSNLILEIIGSMWKQTSPLFSKKFIRKTTLICFLQFCTFTTGHGMYVWFPEILNSVMKFIEKHPGDRMPMCRILEIERNLLDGTSEGRVCIENLEISTYTHTIILEILYTTCFLLMGSVMKIMSRIKILFIILVTCGGCGVASVIVDIPLLGIYLFVVQLLTGLAVTVVSSTTVDLFPTHLRAMAVCISLMMGRVGSVVGSNIAGWLLVNNCEWAFYGSGFALILSGCLGFLLPKPKINTTTAVDNSDEKEIDVIS